MNLKEKIKKLKTKVSALYLALKRKDTPLLAKIVAGMTVGYALSPIDLIPDFIPILGYLDDIIILPLLIALSIRLVPKRIMEECEVEARGMWRDGKPKKWCFAIPIIVIWMFLIVLIAYKILDLRL
jgi:uncharacterized membrane protein YkvA (DUF1232 family)